jgi:AbrB family looped-hinge helix DNA binding protein
MATSTISTRGQLTIPKEIRDAFDLREGDKVEFRKEDGKLVLVRCRSEENPFLKYAGIGPPVPGGSVAWVRWIRGHAPDEFDE